MKIGLFFGSFNPIHIGHLVIGSFMVEYSDLEQVWFVVSPQNPLKNKKNLLSEYDRLDMVKTAIADDLRFQASDIEFNLPRPSYTIDTLTYLKERYPNDEFVLIMGSDTVNTLPKWKNYEILKNDFKIYAYPRPGAEIDLEVYPNVKVFPAPLMEISASFIRSSIKNSKSMRYLLPEPVISLIDKWGFYR